MKLTPATIVEKRLFFSIPIYQRLFEWDTENIVTLLEDLKKSFANSPDQDYYIGMLTSTKDNELVDGQQRFTVMMLMGCVFQKYYSQWRDFLYGDNQRLYFASRPNDNAYMMSLIDIANKDNQALKNIKMQNGIDEIDKFIKISIDGEGKRTNFASYIYNHLCFFISELPTGYNPRDLNKYFERMNTSGKNLEHHEILKVKLLSNLESNISTYMLLWNKLSDVDTLLIRKHSEEDENSFSYRKQRALSSNIETILTESLINGLGAEKEEESFSIESIPPSEDIPKSERDHTDSSHCALTFPYILLQTLYRMLLEEKIYPSIDDFFKPSNLLDIFSEYLPYEGPKVNVERINSFMEYLVKGRLTLDICFVRPTEFGYSLDMNTNEDDNDLQKLLMLQSMLYVSSSNYTHYKWFGWLMDAVIQNKGIPNVHVLYKHLKTADEKEHKLPDYKNLSYGEIRYWFWKLDLHIWLNRKNIFKEKPEALKVADNYVFRRNRSIEHIAPQTPLSNSDMIWEDTENDKEIMNSFGNLVMISQGLNSSLKNESFEIKKSHVQSYCNGSKIGSIESLKLLVVYQYKQYEKWSRANIEEHGHLMYEWLKDSFEK